MRAAPNYKLIREDPDAFDRNADARYPDAAPHGTARRVAELHTRVAALRAEADALRKLRREHAASIARQRRDGPGGLATGATGAAAATAAAAADPGRDLRREIADAEVALSEVEDEMRELALSIPNTTHPDTPTGDETRAVVRLVREGATALARGIPRSLSAGDAGYEDGPSGSPGGTRADGWAAKPHFDLCEGAPGSRRLRIYDARAGASVSGARFVFLTGDGARLSRALQQLATEHALETLADLAPLEVECPELVRPSMVAACGFRPRGTHSQIYEVPAPQQQQHQASLPRRDGGGGRVGDDGLLHGDDSGGALCLAGTAEIPMAGMHANASLPAASLPLTYAARSACFRREAGNAGRAARGLYRLHQFSKVELFAVTEPERSGEVLDRFLDAQVSLFSDRLGLGLRVLDMPTEELGASAHRKFDVEAWMPGRGGFGEICSGSDCTDYQARRLAIRIKKSKDTGKNKGRGAAGGAVYAHTVNATMCAVPRVIIAILETYQQEDGSVIIPQDLRPYMGGRDVIEPVALSKLG